MNGKGYAGVAAIAILFGTYAVWRFENKAAIPPPEVAVASQSVTATAAPPSQATVRYPLPVAKQTALPKLDASDAAVSKALAQAFGFRYLPKYFYPHRIIRRFVATIDNLPRDRTSVRLMPVRPIPTLFKAQSSGGGLVVDPMNALRYRAYIALLQRVDTAKLVDVYVKYYPLFQQAYRELGYPNGYFNDRLIDTLDNLLATPEVDAPISLTQPHVLYLYSDLDLESRSAGQKILLRMGRPNADQVKSILRSIRADLLHRSGLETEGLAPAAQS